MPQLTFPARRDRGGVSAEALHGALGGIVQPGRTSGFCNGLAAVAMIAPMYRLVLFTALVFLATPLGASAAPVFDAQQSVPDTGTAQHEFAIAVAGDGTTLLAVVLGSGPSRQVGVAERPPGGAWGAPVILDTGPVQGFQVAPLLAVNDAGAAVAVWRDSTEGYRASVRPGAGQPFGEAETIAATASEDGRVAIGANGDIVVAWSREVQLPSPGDDSVRAVWRPAGGPWGNDDGVIVEERDYAPGTFRVYDVAFTAGGIPSILYGDTREQDVAFEQRNPGGGWVNENAPLDIPDSQVGPLGSEGRLAPFADGRLLAVWIEFGAEGRRVRHGIRPATGGTWQPIDNTSIWFEAGDPTYVPQNLEVGVTDAGEAIAAWYAPNPSGARVMVARMSASAEWSDAVPFAGGLVPFAAAADGGAMAAFWTQPGSGNWSVGADPGAPLGAAAPLAPGATGSVMAAGGALLVAGWKSGVDAPITTVTAGGGSPPPRPPPPGPQPQPVPPALGAEEPAMLSALKARCTKPAGRRRCRIRLSFAVDKATDVRITVKRVGKKRRLGRITRSVAPPQATLRLPAKFNGKRLRRGRYRIIVGVPDGQTHRLTVRVR